MSIFASILSSKLKLLTFVILPLIIVILLGVMAYLYINRGNQVNQLATSIESAESITNQENSTLVSTTNSLNTSIVSKSKTTKTFEDITTRSSKSNLISSAVAISSPIGSNPEIDSIEIDQLLTKIEADTSSDDKGLDNQILSN
jgi:hypothetical protein